MQKEPLALALHRRGALHRRARLARRLVSPCTLCPHRCQVRRDQGQHGRCQVGDAAEVVENGPHFGEESVLVGQHGSGTIFFAGCCLQCVFCQNYAISHPDTVGHHPPPLDGSALAGIMLGLQEQGCHNINLVTPSHLVPVILEALDLALAKGLRLPLVYNCGGYESLETLRLLAGVVDIYMPDAKFWTPESARRYTNAPDYPQVMQAALKAMYRQVGDLQLDADGLAVQGLLVRHLVMPGMEEESMEILSFISREISCRTWVNIMDQYHPCGQAAHFPEINRLVDKAVYDRVVAHARTCGLQRLDSRDWGRLLRWNVSWDW